jgi:hypothetical protein
MSTQTINQRNKNYFRSARAAEAANEQHESRKYLCSLSRLGFPLLDMDNSCSDESSRGKGKKSVDSSPLVVYVHEQ